MTRALVILGTGGSAYDVLDIVEAINALEVTWEVRGFLDDARPVGSEHLGLPVMGRLSDAGLRPLGECWFINCIGSDRSYRQRAEIIERSGLSADRFATLVHPGASVSSRARVGRGSYVNFGASVGGGVRVGDQVSVGPGVIVGHDGVVEDYAMLAPGAVVSGFVRVGRGSYVGAGAVVRQQVTVGAGALVGMGAVVTRDVAEGEVVVGSPAKPMSARGRIPEAADVGGGR